MPGLNPESEVQGSHCPLSFLPALPLPPQSLLCAAPYRSCLCVYVCVGVGVRASLSPSVPSLPYFFETRPLIEPRAAQSARLVS